MLQFNAFYINNIDEPGRQTKQGRTNTSSSLMETECYVDCQELDWGRGG